MRINNPRAFTAYNDSAVNNASYNLATIGQLEQKVQALDDEIKNILRGTAEHNNGAQGLTNRTGYAWLDANGKLAAELLPNFAVTDVKTVLQSTLKAYQEQQVGDNANVIDRLKYWKRSGEGKNLPLLAGDIIVVTPGEGDTVDSLYCGAYIVSSAPRINDDGSAGDPENEGWDFVKISYESGNIVTINDVSPKTNGAMDLFLSDILRRSAVRTTDAGNPNGRLADTLSRFSQVDSTGLSNIFNNVSRFAFKVGDNEIQTYTLTDEFQTEHNARVAAEEEILANLTAADEFLSGSIDYVSGAVSGLRNDVGTKNDAPGYAAADTIYSQIFGLRNLVDVNADVLNTTIAGTNQDISKLQDNLDYLCRNLSNHAIELSSLEFGFDDVAPEANWNSANTPIAPAFNTITDGEAKAYFKQGTYIYRKLVLSNPGSDQRILAIYDNDGNEIIADVKHWNAGSENDPTWNNEITIEVDHIVNEDKSNADEYAPAMNGKKFTVLFTTQIELTLPETPSKAVAGNKSAKDSANPV